jgi:hypothetical protein
LGKIHGQQTASFECPAAGFAWGANAREIDMATPPAKPVPLKIAAAPQNVTIDLKRTAMIVIDMQNDFCAKGGWVDYLGADYTPTAPIAIAEAPAGAASAGVPGELGQIGPTWPTCR